MNCKYTFPAIILLLLGGALRGADTTLALKDTRGQTISVPSDQTAVLAFVRADQPQSTDELAQLAALLKDKKNLQVTIILSGDDAPATAGKLAASASFPVAADPAYAASGANDVHVWPTLVIVSKSGERIAHIAGLPSTFSNDVPAYLDFAAGQIDKTGLEKRLAERPVVVDSSDQKAARHVEVAKRLAEQGMKDAALQELARAFDNKPTKPDTLLAIARIELIAARPDDAAKTLQAIPSGAIQPAQLATLQGWAAIEKNDWAQAKKLLESATTLNPDPAGAFYLYGVVLQHDGDTAKAAAAFRQAFEHTPAGKPVAIP